MVKASAPVSRAPYPAASAHRSALGVPPSMSDDTALAEQLGGAALLDGMDRSLHGVRLYAGFADRDVQRRARALTRGGHAAAAR
jgi:hypothetical protein